MSERKREIKQFPQLCIYSSFVCVSVVHCASGILLEGDYNYKSGWPYVGRSDRMHVCRTPCKMLILWHKTEPKHNVVRQNVQMYYAVNTTAVCAVCVCAKTACQFDIIVSTPFAIAFRSSFDLFFVFVFYFRSN